MAEIIIKFLSSMGIVIVILGIPIIFDVIKANIEYEPAKKALRDQLEPGEDLHQFTVGSSDIGKEKVFIGLTEKRLFILKASQPHILILNCQLQDIIKLEFIGGTIFRSLKVQQLDQEIKSYSLSYFWSVRAQNLVKSNPVSNKPTTDINIRNRSIPDYLSESESLASSGNYNKAAQVLEEAIAEEPFSRSIIAGDPDENPPHGYALLLQLVAESGNKELALEYYRRMLNLNPQMPENAKKAAKKAGIL